MMSGSIMPSKCQIGFSVVNAIRVLFILVAMFEMAGAFAPSMNRIQVVGSKQASLNMISFPGTNNNDSASTSLPRDVKDAVSKCRQAVQEALKSQLSRMDVEMPVGTNFGVEKTKSKRKASDGAPTREVLDTSDRELARLFVEMFQPVGGENICVAFRDDALADLAKKKWKADPGASSRIVGMNRSKSSQKPRKKSARGFAAKLAEEVGDESTSSRAFNLQPGTEVAIFVSPGPKELVVIEKICSTVGMGTLVILLNARLSKISNFGTEAGRKLFQEEFEPVFCLSAAPQDVAPDCLLYRAYPSGWTMARKPRIGQPKPILSTERKPSSEQCKQAYESMLTESTTEANIESALENIAGWFK